MILRKAIDDLCNERKSNKSQIGHAVDFLGWR